MPSSKEFQKKIIYTSALQFMKFCSGFFNKAASFTSIINIDKGLNVNNRF